MEKSAHDPHILLPTMRTPSWILSSCILVLCFSVWCPAQNRARGTSDKGISLGEEKVSKWRVGMEVTATKGPMKSVYATIPVPISWPEQSVKVLQEDVTRGVKVSYRDLGGVRQMLVRVRGLPNGQTAKALFTYEIKRRNIEAPPEPEIFEVPKRVPREVKRWLGSSPYIDTRDSRIRELARDVTREKESAWEQVEAIYDSVRENVEYKEGKIKSASQALRDGYGDCEELTSLFIAMCRIKKIPARMVWVPDHCYPEFYLSDDDGTGHWIPCQAAGTRAFGSMPELRPVLQKGDSFAIGKQTKRYVSEFVSADPVRGSGRPKVTFIREFVQPGG